MPVHVLTGSDSRALVARREELTSTFGGDVTRFDLTTDAGSALAVAASSYSLFSAARVLIADPLPALDITHAERLTRVDDSTLVVLVGSTAPSSRLREALRGAAWESFAPPSPRDALRRVSAVAESLALTLDPDARDLLVAAAPGSWGRVDDTLHELRELGLSHVTRADVAPLLGSATDTATPWTVATHLESGDLRAALTSATLTEPLGVIAHLARRMENTGRVLDSGARTAGQARERTGLTASAATAAFSLARRLGSDGVARSWDLIAQADVDAKLSGRPGQVCDRLLCELTALWDR